MRRSTAATAQNDDLALFLGHPTDHQIEQQKQKGTLKHRQIFGFHRHKLKSLDSLLKKKKPQNRPCCWQPGCGLRMEISTQIYMKIKPELGSTFRVKPKFRERERGWSLDFELSLLVLRIGYLQQEQKH